MHKRLVTMRYINLHLPYHTIPYHKM